RRGYINPGGDGGPTCIQEQADAMVECVKAGAAAIHTHPRHPSDGLTRIHAPKVLTSTMDAAFEEVDFITAHHTWDFNLRHSWETDYISNPKELLKMGKGNKYVQTNLILTAPSQDMGYPIHSMETIAKGVKWMEENDVKPIFSSEHFMFHRLKKAIFDRGIAKWKPYLIVMQVGKHWDDFTDQDPWSYRFVINTMEKVKRNMPEEDMVLGINPACRNWLPMAVMGLLYGAQYIRVGLEDQFWLYPHKPDTAENISKKASDTVEMVVQIAKALGRKIATVDEAREIIGIKYTSPD
ncbi:hypothetical protein MCGE09_00239, partial [Thaumarchaeota archaeon SCGC AB-539-E09]